jgi:hypothetical protein
MKQVFSTVRWTYTCAPALQRPRYDRDDAPSEHMEVDRRTASARAETPEEGEI